MIQTPVSTFQQAVGEIREQVNDALGRYLDLPEDCPQRLRDAMRYSLFAPCKRLRPTLVILAAEACGGAASVALPAACAVEMIHTYSLIHDDLPAMDDDDLRRGRATCHKQFDEATAILAGDGLLTLAFEVLARELEPPSIAAACCVELASAAGVVGMVGGQADDLSEAFGGGDLEMLQSIHRRKTGALIRGSLRMGALVAKADDVQLTAMENYGSNVGLAFQITDDLLDVRGDESAMGKRIGRDAEHGKLTFPGLIGAEASGRRAEQLIAAAIDALAPIRSGGEGRRATESLEGLARYVLERRQ